MQIQPGGGLRGGTFFSVVASTCIDGKAGSANMDMLSVKGRDVCVGGKPVRLCGVNCGNWMLVEAYMLGLPWTEHRMRQAFHEILGPRKYHAFWDTFMESFVADEDFAYMRRLGFNMVQLPFNWHHFSSQRASAAFEQRGLEHMDRFVRLCAKHGMYVLLGMHAAPGCQARDWNAESNWGETDHWGYRHWQEQTLEIWRTIARRYRDEPAVMGYELPNEPVTDDVPEFTRFNLEQIRVIRREDPEHIVVVNSNRWGKDISSLDDKLFRIPNVIPSLHHYHLQFKPFDQLRTFPGTHGGKRYGEKELFATLDSACDFERIRRPHLVGECGVYCGPNQDQRTRDSHYRMWDLLLGHYNQLGMSWNFWALKDIGAMGLLYPGATTPWQRFLRSARVLTLRESFWKGQAGMRGAIDRSAPWAVGEDVDLMLYGLQHHWDAALLPKVIGELRRYGTSELRDMARSFAYKNCTADANKHKILVARAAEVHGINVQTGGAAEHNRKSQQVS